MIVGRTLYSVPYLLIGKRLDARATAAAVEFYLDGELVKTHLFQPRGRRTDWPTCPSTRPRSSCAPRLVPIPGRAGLPGVRDAGRRPAVGERPVPLRQVQGVLQLCQRYGDALLEAACALAL